MTLCYFCLGEGEVDGSAGVVDVLACGCCGCGGCEILSRITLPILCQTKKIVTGMRIMIKTMVIAEISIISNVLPKNAVIGRPSSLSSGVGDD